MKKTVALLLALTLLFSLCACGSENEEAETPEETSEAAPETESGEAEAPVEETPDPFAVLAAGLSVYPTDKIVMTINGREITWDLYYYALNNYLYSFLSMVGAFPDDYNLEIDGVTLSQQFLDSVDSMLRSSESICERGRALDQEDEVQSALDEEWTALCEQNGGEETVCDLLLQRGITPSAYKYFIRCQIYSDMLFASFYGEDCSAITDEDAAAWAEENNYVRCKHILRLTEGMEDADKAAVRTEMEDYLAVLEPLKDDIEALDAKFDELITEYTEDPGSSVYTDGYFFTTGQMVAAFEDTAFALGDNELSGIVESSYGFHILLRLPCVGSMLAQADSYTGQMLTLAELVANQRFSEQVDAWLQETTGELTEDFRDFNMQDFMDSIEVE